MRSLTVLSSADMFTMAFILGVSFLAPTGAKAQSAGNNAVYYYTTANPGVCCTNSAAFIDASVFTASFPNVCGILHGILTGVSSAGAVIDARGLNSSNTSMTCTASPWGSGSSYLNVPSTILLPATTATVPIQIPTPWILPNNTRLIGQGDGIPTSTTAPITKIQASSSFSGNMIQFGSSACPSIGGVPVCSGISVENLTLDGQGGSINGIVNQSSQDFSYVDHVSLYQIRSTGLLVSTSANNSGPYSNITFDTGGYAGTSETVCAQINGLSGTHGLHGLSCTSETNDAPAAVLLDSSNNSISDVGIVGFYDGVLVGANASAQSNVLRNIIGDTTHPSGLTPVNTVHISNNHTVTDLSIMGFSNSGVSGTYTLEDDVTGPHLSDAIVGVYALGEKDSVTGGYSRYTTSPNLPTWAVGTNSPPSGSCIRGSLYSCIGGNSSCKIGSGTTYALWDCLSSGWTGVK
jgi:hypothetical protein